MCLCVAGINGDVIANGIYRAESPDGEGRYASAPPDPSDAVLRGALLTKPSGKASDSRRLGMSISSKEVDPLIRQLAAKHQIDAALVHAIIDVESKFNANAMSPKGAIGLMQLMPSTARRYGGGDISDPARNIELGILHLKRMLSLYRGNLVLALSAYNAGEGVVAKYGNRIPPYRETMLYVPAVLARFEATRNTSAP
jgi:soluble lytic murein transglycosylase-like protein